MIVNNSVDADFDRLISLSREVESLFGPMADEDSFRDGLKAAIKENKVFCARDEKEIKGAIIISEEQNGIAWLVVSEKSRNKGCGKLLLDYAIEKLNSENDIVVQTFDSSVPEGKAARKLYKKMGFKDYKNGGLNPAGVSTVIMKRSPIDIRKSKKCDIDQILDIWLFASIKAHNFIDKSFWESQVENMRNIYLPASEVFVYEINSEIAGFYALKDNILAAIFVKPELQGNGIGKSLIKHAKGKCNNLSLTVYKDNKASYQFYLRHGFVVVKEQVDSHTGHMEFLMKTEQEKKYV